MTIPYPDPISDHRPRVRAMLGIIVVALAWASLWCFIGRNKSYRALDEEPKIAAHLALGHGYLSPIDPSPNTIPTSWTPPLYPFAMAGVYKSFGVGTPASVNVMLAINAISFALTAAGLYVLGTMLLRSSCGGVASAALFCLHPLFFLRLFYCWDTFPALAMFAWLCVASLAIARSKKGPTFLRLALLGIALGILALTNASYALAYPLLVLTATSGAGIKNWFRQLQLAAIAFVTFIAVITPWTIRNYRVFDQLFFIRGGVNLELWLGNLPGNTGWMNLNQHPSLYKPDGQLMLKLGEPAYFKLCGDRFKENLNADRPAFYRRCLNRVLFLFISDPSADRAIRVTANAGQWATYARVGFDAVMLLLALIGAMIALATKRPLAAIWIPALALLIGGPFVITHVSYRYAMPIRMLLLILAAATISAVINRAMETRRHTR